MKYKTIVRWILGMWSTGLGSRMVLELLITEPGTYVCIPKLWINIYFDFGVLMALGLIVLVIETREMCRLIRERESEEHLGGDKE